MKYIVEQNFQFRTFRAQILRSLEGFDGYQDDIHSVTIQAKHYAEKNLDIFDICSENFSLILHLVNNGKDFLDSIGTEKALSTDDYKQLLEIFSEELD